MLRWRPPTKCLSHHQTKDHGDGPCFVKDTMMPPRKLLFILRAYVRKIKELIFTLRKILPRPRMSQASTLCRRAFTAHGKNLTRTMPLFRSTISFSYFTINPPPPPPPGRFVGEKARARARALRRAKLDSTLRDAPASRNKLRRSGAVSGDYWPGFSHPGKA